MALSRVNCFKLAQCLHNLSRMNMTCMHCKKPQKLIHMSMKMKWEFISSVSVNFHSFSLFQKHRKCRQCCSVHSLLEVLFACFLSRRHSLFSTYHRRCKYFSFCQFPPPHTSSTSVSHSTAECLANCWAAAAAANDFAVRGKINEWNKLIHWFWYTTTTKTSAIEIECEKSSTDEEWREKREKQSREIFFRWLWPGSGTLEKK